MHAHARTKCRAAYTPLPLLNCYIDFDYWMYTSPMQCCTSASIEFSHLFIATCTCIYTQLRAHSIVKVIVILSTCTCMYMCFQYSSNKDKKTIVVIGESIVKLNHLLHVTVKCMIE